MARPKFDAHLRGFLPRAISVDIPHNKPYIPTAPPDKTKRRRLPSRRQYSHDCCTLLPVGLSPETDSAAIDSRADGSIIENNYVENTSGAGIRLGGNTVDGRVYGINNKVGLC